MTGLGPLRKRCFFFFQAEDGIRDYKVTGVQTCALPIYPYLITAADLRKNLNEIRQTLDPDKKDAALDDMVMVGHSMGGLVSRLLTTHGEIGRASCRERV